MKKKNLSTRFFNKIEELKESKNLKRTLIFTFIICLIVIVVVTWVQLIGQSKISVGCSYLDPITIDLLAFFAALFLVIEGFARIIEHPNASIKRQLTRIIRIGFGCAITTLHILQFLHK
jgi:heme/copper-type cytochrome/quinol oxidase subunit 4